MPVVGEQDTRTIFFSHLSRCAIVLAVFAAVVSCSASYVYAANLDWSTRPTTNLLTGSDTANVSNTSITTSGVTSGTFNTRLIQIQPTGSSNGYTGYIISQMDAANDNESSIQTTTISFSSPVYNLSFKVFDIDGGPAFNDGTNAWHDIVDFSSDAGVPTSAVTAANVSYNVSTGRASATANANLTDATGNITVTYAGPINWITIKHIAGAVPGTNNPTNQYIFIDDLTFLAPQPTVSIQKVSTGGTGTFSFSATNLNSAPGSITTSTSGTAAPTTPTPIAVTTTGAAVTISETSLPSGYGLTGVQCTDSNATITGNSGSFGSVSGNTVTIPASAIVSFADINCIFTNTRAVVRVAKISEGGTGTFSFSDSNLQGSISAITTTSADTSTPSPNSPRNIRNLSNPVSITEAPASGFVLTSAGCIDANAATTGNTGTIGTLSGNTLTIPSANIKPGVDFTCTFTNTRATVTVRKVTLGAAGGPFSFSQTNLASTPSSITTTSPGVAAPASPTAINITTIGTAVTLTETVASGYAISSASCTDTNSAVTGNTGSFGTLSGTTLTIPASRVVAGAKFDCIVTNRKIPTVSLQKITLGGSGGPFTFAATNLASSPSGITTTATGTAAPASPTAIAVTTNGTDVTITETIASGYFISGATCTDANAAITGNTGSIGSLSGSTLTIPGAAVVDGADFRCTFTNTLAVPQLAVAKSASVANVNAAGDAITYTVTVSNTGNVTVTGISVTDPLGTLVCTTSGNATIASLAPGASETCSFTYTVTQAVIDANGGGDGDIDNTATASGSYGAVTVQASGSTAVTIILNPRLAITKTADDVTDVVAGQVITYTYVVTNTGNQTIANVSLSDSHNGSGPAPVPGSETLSTDAGPSGDSTDATVSDGVWSSLAPGDAVTFTATYTVTQRDVDTRQ